MVKTLPFVIGICGPSGSGKSSLARKLARRLHAIVISTDDYFYLDPPLKKYRSKGKNWELPENIDWPALAAVVRKLKTNTATTGRRMVWESETTVTKKISPRPVLIIEGFLLLHSRDVRDLLDLAVYIDVSDEVCVQRRLVRDGSTKNEKWYREVTFPEYAPRRAAFKRRADVVLDGMLPVARLADTVVAQVPSRLRSGA